MPVKQKIDGTVYRSVKLIPGSIDEETRTIKLSFSSELPVLRSSFFQAPWNETLGHKRNEVNLDRIAGAPVLYNHSRTRGDRIGVIESAKINTKDKRGEATIRISTRDDVNDIWHDIKTGVLTNVSVGYNINERKLTQKSDGISPDSFRVTRWTPAEISLVDIPADHTVGIGRSDGNDLDVRASYPDLPEPGEFYRIHNLDSSFEGKKMFRKDTAGNFRDDAGNVVTEDGTILRTAIEAPEHTVTERFVERKIEVKVDATEAQVEAAKREGAAIESTRRTEISAALSVHAKKFSNEALAALRIATIDNADCDINAARKIILDKLGENVAPVSSVRVEAGDTSGEKFVRGATASILQRAGIASEGEDAGNEFRGLSLVDIARRSLDLSAISHSGLSRMELVGRAFTTSDFPLILAAGSNKSMLKGFAEAPETWQMWAQAGNLSDFKQSSRVNLSAFNSLEQVNEDGEYKYGQFEENGETIKLATYGKLFAISRQAIINDDLQAFTKIPERMGRAASRVAGDLAYSVLTANPVMSDGIALFHASHNNLQGAAAISAVEVDKMRVAMGLQKDVSDSSHGSNIRPKYLLAPLALETVAKVLQTSSTDPKAANANANVPNPVAGTFETITDPRLDAASSSIWYMVSGQEFDTVEVAFLDGVAAPTLESQNGWSKDGTEFKVRIDCAAAPMEWRTLQRNG